MGYFQVIFVPKWMKQTLLWLNLQKHGTGNGLSNFKDTFAESLQLQILVLHQSKVFFKAGPSRLYDGSAKFKEIVPDMLDPNQNVQGTCNFKLRFT